MELLRPYNDTSETCPECGGIMKKLISPVNHSFGWKMSDKFYETPGMDDREGLVKNV